VSTFFHLLHYVRRTILRARTRSLLTVLGTALALGLFAFVRTLESGVERLARASSRPVLVVFQSSRFCPLTSELPVRYARDIERLEGVEAVLPTLLHINSCRANLDLVTIHGVDPSTVSAIHDIRWLSGDLAAWGGRSDAAVVGERLARRRGLDLGDRLRLGNVDVQVSGIVSSPGGLLDNLAFVHLDQLQLARRLQGKVTEFLVRVAPGADAEAIARAIDERFRVDEQPTDTKTMQAFVQGAIEELNELVGFGRLLGYLAVAVVVLVLGNTVWISAQTRMTEIGVLQTLGATRLLVAALLVAEGVGLAVLGGLLGAGGVALVLFLKPVTLGVEGFGIDLLPSAGLLGLCVLVSIGVGLVASVGPAIEALRRPLAVAVKPS
jgi:putative ABC transport system permease protein